ncbi:Zinc uptake regulation protein [Serratia fonticola]|uniref:Zinc uptake regulation protein n=1 Tax=Serratia fonticola TaxID=47917 RepID=A0A4U9TL60_SERFO|nr:Zinc uptake regulation protein [Serratia fonticola]
MNSTNQEKLLAQAETTLSATQRATDPRNGWKCYAPDGWSQPGAISAYDLLDLLRVAEPQAKPPTVYRALDFLLEQGFIHRVESANSYVLCHHFEQPMHTSAPVYLRSLRTGHGAHYRRGGRNLAETGSRIRVCACAHSVVEAHGLCSACVVVENCENQHDCDHDHSIVVNEKNKADWIPGGSGYVLVPVAVAGGKSCQAGWCRSAAILSGSSRYQRYLLCSSQAFDFFFGCLLSGSHSVPGFYRPAVRVSLR